MKVWKRFWKASEILSGLPGLDCGSCGSPTCKALAEDIVKGVDCAQPEDCIYLMREQWKQHSRQKEEEELMTVKN
ncbi:MAG: (Fe-S)-binding protein [Eubacterium ramulus]